jgi:hypothetical protein
MDNVLLERVQAQEQAQVQGYAPHEEGEHVVE